jgi:hypothetical protein
MAEQSQISTNKNVFAQVGKDVKIQAVSDALTKEST